MPSELGKKGLEKGLITQKQYDKLPPHLLDAIVKKVMLVRDNRKVLVLLLTIQKVKRVKKVRNKYISYINNSICGDF